MPSQYDFEHTAEERLTAYAGVPLSVRTARSLGISAGVQHPLDLKQRRWGLDQAANEESLPV